MKKRIIIISVTCIFLLIAGICYSCAYQGNHSSAVVTTLSGEDEQVKEVKNNVDSKASLENEQATKADSEKTDNSSQSLGDNDIRQQEDNLSVAMNDVADTPGASNNSDIYVHICGAVIEPGVYQVSIEARVIDLIELAGGLGTDAAGDYVNQAQQVKDGQRIYIPSTEEVKDLTSKEYVLENISEVADNASAPKLININTANAEELMELPGIGEAKASSIIEYRTQKGSFSATSDLMKIPGIKEGLFNKVAQYITVE